MKQAILVGCVMIGLVLGLSGCDWENATTSTGGVDFNMTGDYTIRAGWTPFDDIMIWQTGSSLRAIDDLELVWEGSVNASKQVYLQLENQNTGLTEWIRGRIILEGGMVVLEGIYSRSDRAETNWFELEAYQDPDNWPDGAAATAN